MGDVVIDVRVIPRARASAFGGLRNGALVVRLSAPPVEGAANDALIAFLADAWSLPRRAIRIVSGDKSRAKRVAIAGVTPEEIQARMNRCSPTS